MPGENGSANGTGGGEATPWHKGEGFDPELTGFVEHKGFKTPGALAKSYRELEKLQRTPRERLLELPDANADAAAWEPVYQRLGRPEKPEDYGDLPAVKAGEVDLTPDIKALVHKAGLNPKQAKALVEGFGARTAALAEAREAELETRAANELAALKREWGQEFDRNIRVGKEVVQRTYAAMGYANAEAMQDDLSAIERQIGTGKFLKLFAFIGRGLGEHTFEAGDGKGGGSGGNPYGMTPDRARAAMASLRADPAWVAARLDPSHPGYAEAQRKYVELEKIASAGS